MNPADLKRQILMESDRLGIRKKITGEIPNDTGINNDLAIQIGTAFDTMQETKGWAFLDAYLTKRADPTILAYGFSEGKAGEVRCAMETMQYVDQMVKTKNELLAKMKAKKEENATT